MVQAPLGTYCGWNLRARGFGHGAMHGQLHPVSGVPGRKAYDRRSARSIPGRFPTAEAYVSAVTAAARHLVEQGLMLEEDVERAVPAAADWCRPRHDIKLL